MKDNVRVFVAACARELDLRGPVVEIGAFQVAGQEGYADLRPYFPGREYVGCDMRPGPGVDRVEDAARLSFPDAGAGAVISCDTFVHLEDPFAAAREIHRILRPGGVAVVSSVMDFFIHAHPSDYWRFTPEGLDVLFRRFPLRLIAAAGYELHPHSVFAVAVKGDGDARRRELERLKERLARELPRVPTEKLWWPEFPGKRVPHGGDFSAEVRLGA
jgi:SAM-dependent methyltransferase